MKYLKSCAAALLALAAADAAFAQTTIRITGSTAFRAGTVTSIKNLLTPGFDVAFTGTSDTGAQYITFVGTTTASGISGQAVVIQCAWTGSVEGVRDVSQGLTQPFIKGSFVTATVATSGTSAITTDTAIYENTIPDVTLADNTQAATTFTTPALQETQVGVIPFVWVKGRVSGSHPATTAFSTINNVTGLLAQALLTGGANISLATGTVDTTGTKLYVLGRNPLSGTRLVTFAESGYGSTSPATQFKPTLTGDVTTGTITAVDLNPAGSGFLIGNNGYSSGGTLADELGRTVTDTTGSGNLYDGVPFGLVGYVGIGDATRMVKNINTTLSTNVSNVLSYNGVSLNPVYSTSTQAITWDFTPIKEGKYSFWSYEYVGYRKSSGPNSTVALAGIAKSFADALIVDITATVPATTGVKLSDMKVQRAVEGGIISSL
jgi:hypothetical protein